MVGKRRRHEGHARAVLVLRAMGQGRSQSPQDEVITAFFIVFEDYNHVHIVRASKDERRTAHKTPAQLIDIRKAFVKSFGEPEAPCIVMYYETCRDRKTEEYYFTLSCLYEMQME